MQNELALPKRFWEISFYGSSKAITIAIHNTPDWETVMRDKEGILDLDGYIIRNAAISLVKEVFPGDVDADTGLSYAKSLSGAIREVAMQRVMSYESSNGKMSVTKLKSRIKDFTTNPAKYPNYEKILRDNT